MSTLQTKGFSQIVGMIAAGMQGRIASRFLNFALGSMLRGLVEAYAGVLLWIQKQSLDIAKLTRLSTSYGADVDSFVADFPLSGVERIGATAATGLCSFARYTASAAAVFVPVGGLVKTSDGTQAFEVIADTRSGSFIANYTPPGAALPTGGYVMPAQAGSVVAPVRGVTTGATGAPGANGNVAAGLISLIASNMPGVDTVTNVAGFTNGSDVESDDSVKARFRLAVRGRGGGTVPAIQSAVANLKVGMSCVVLEDRDLDGTPDPGMVTVIVDDGSGAPSSDLVTAAANAVALVRAAGIRTGVFGVVTLYATVTMTIATKPGYDHNTVVAQVVAALGLYINTIGQNTTLPYFGVAGVTLGVPGVAEILPGTFFLNAGTVDIAATPQTTIKAGQLIVS